MKRLVAVVLVITLLACSLFTGCTEKDQKVEYATPETEAVVVTALSFLARGNRIQYDDTRFSPGDAIPRVYRWQHSLKSPEDYTTQFYGYTNCAAFVHDVYLEALDYDVMHTTTASFIEASEDIRAFRYYPDGTETEERKAELEKQYRETLQPGDIIIIRYGGDRKGNGHAMLYVGEETLKGVQAAKGTQVEGSNSADAEDEKEITYDIIHSTGSSYDYTDFSEKFEEQGSVQMMAVDDLFDPASRRYVFDCDSFAIIRPLNTWQNGVPEKTQNRINNMQGVIAEKLCSHTSGMTVNPGGELTFTFSIENTNTTDVTLDVADRVPAHTTYVTGADTVDGDALYWQVTVPAGETKTVSYTVKVADDASLCGEYIHGEDGTVGGVDTDCPRVYIANTLTADQQKQIVTTAVALQTSELRGMELANAIYTQALGTTDLLPDTFDTAINDVFTDYYGSLTHYMLTDSGYYSDMVVPTMYGGRYIAQLDARFDDMRTRLPYPQDVMVGDLIIIAGNADASIRYLYLCLGDTMLELCNADHIVTKETAEVTDNVLGYNRFAILRPSMGM